MNTFVLSLRSRLRLLPTLLATLLFTFGCLASAQSSTPAAAKKAPVRFLMHNVEDYFVAGEQQRSRYTIHPKPEASREAVADVIAEAEPDIVGLIEIGGEQALNDLRQRLAERGLDYPHSRVLTRRGEDRALALLSRYPIAEDNSHADYSLYGEQRRKMLRGILDITVKHSDGRSFRIVGAHLKSHVAKNEAAATDLRRREAETLTLYIGKALKLKTTTRLILFGDMNDNPDAPALASLAELKGLRRLSPEDPQGERWTLFYRGSKPTCVYDQLYVSPLTRKLMGEEPSCGIINLPHARRASAHRAVWCELR